MMNMGRRFERLLIVLVIMAIFEGVFFGFIGSKTDSFAMAISLSGIWTGFIVGLLLTAIIVSYESRKKSNAETELTVQRLGISERAAYGWSVAGNALRFLLIMAYQTLLIYAIYRIYQSMGVSDTTELQEFIGFNGIQILRFFFPVASLMNWFGILLLALSFGTAATALNIRRMKVSKVVLFIWIGYLMIKVMTNTGFSFDTSMMLVRIILLGTDLTFLFYLLVIGHDGKSQEIKTMTLRGETK